MCSHTGAAAPAGVWAAAAALCALVVAAQHGSAGGPAAAAGPTAGGSVDAWAALQQLCAPFGGLTLADNGLSKDLLGPQKRVNTSTASWGYFRFGNTSSPRPPLLLLPGFGSTLTNWPLDLLAALAAEQEVVVVDNRGQGLTVDFQPLEPLTIPGMANDTMEFIDALDLGEPPNVMGWSMGGMLAISLMALHGDELGKASTAACPLSVVGLRVLGAGTITQYGNTIISVAGSAGGLDSTPPTDRAAAILINPAKSPVQGLSNLFLLDTPEGAQAACKYAADTLQTVQSPGNATTTARQLGAVANYFFYEESVWDLLPAAANPVLLVAGLEDEAVPADNSRVMVERLQEPWPVTYPDSAHAAFLQHQPSFLRVLNAFLSED